jgi:NADPH:quinone reductase-like Zn-dependent oxidoreductase
MVPFMAKAYALANGFGLDALSLVEWPAEAVPHGHVRLAIEGVSLNRRDLLLVEGKYAPRLRFPAIPGSDAAGTVTEVGAGCTRWGPGDRVVAHMFPDWLAGTPSAAALRGALGGPVRQGTLRAEMVLPEAALLPIPAGLSTREAATLPCSGLAAWAAVVKFGRVRAGRSVLLQGTGGVSIFALQFAKMLGATVVATSSAPEKLARLTGLGADFVVDYARDEIGRTPRGVTLAARSTSWWRWWATSTPRSGRYVPAEWWRCSACSPAPGPRSRCRWW